jgi:tetratricopeptide (TPR) repeat protein
VGYADAHAHNAQFLMLYANIFARDVDELDALRVKALRFAKLALRLKPDLPAGHRAMAEHYRNLLDLGRAYAQYRRALELAPGDATTNRDYASFIARLGRARESLQLVDKVLQLDPLNPASYLTRFSVLLGNRDFEGALAFANATAKKSPTLFDIPELMGMALVHLGRLEEAQRHFNRAPADSYRRLVGESVVLIRTGRRSGVEQKIAAIRQYYGDAASYQYGEIYAQLGDKGRAFAALDRAWQIRDSGLLALKVDPLMDPLRGEPRFRTLLNKLGFPT